MRVALASPALWTHIHINEHFDDDKVALWVSRAGHHTLLDIGINILEQYCGVAFFDITDWREQEIHAERIFKFLCSLKAGPQRWKYLSLFVLQPEPLYKFIQLLNEQPAPNMRYLHLSSEPDWNDEEFNEERPLANVHYCKDYSLSECAVPNLREADLTYVSWKHIFDRPKPLLSGLTTLKLSAGQSYHPPLPQIQQLLAANPGLELLHISAEFTFDYDFYRLPDDQRPNAVHLSSLRTLSLEGGDNISLVWDVLSIINAPSLESPTLANHGLDEEGILAAKILDYLITGKLPESKNSTITPPSKPAFPLLQKLDIEVLVSLKKQRVVDLLSSLPLITHLSMACHQAETSLGVAPHVLPKLRILSLRCRGSHQHYRGVEDVLARRASSGNPIHVIEVPARPQPEPGFGERFPETALRIRDDVSYYAEPS